MRFISIIMHNNFKINTIKRTEMVKQPIAGNLIVDLPLFEIRIYLLTFNK